MVELKYVEGTMYIWQSWSISDMVWLNLIEKKKREKGQPCNKNARRERSKAKHLLTYPSTFTIE